MPVPWARSSSQGQWAEANERWPCLHGLQPASGFLYRRFNMPGVMGSRRCKKGLSHVGCRRNGSNLRDQPVLIDPSLRKASQSNERVKGCNSANSSLAANIKAE
jgi:hypothetical protein